MPHSKLSNHIIKYGAGVGEFNIATILANGQIFRHAEFDSAHALRDGQCQQHAKTFVGILGIIIAINGLNK